VTENIDGCPIGTNRRNIQLDVPARKGESIAGPTSVQVSALIVIGFWIVLQLFSGIGSIANPTDTGGVSYMAQIGGFIAGFVLTFLFRGRMTPRLAG
jgi:membrane associated rhomboid family serine protease